MLTGLPVVKMFTFRIEVAGALADDLCSYYLVTAETAAIAMLMAILVDQQISRRPTNHAEPFVLDEENQIALSREYCKIIR